MVTQFTGEILQHLLLCNTSCIAHGVGGILLFLQRIPVDSFGDCDSPFRFHGWTAIYVYLFWTSHSVSPDRGMSQEVSIFGVFAWIAPKLV